jgi:L-cystine transport system substrate-binding protein
VGVGFMKRFFSLFALLSVFGLILSACGTGGDNKNEGDQAGSGSEAELFDKVKEEGVLVIGTEGTYPPFTFHDDKDKLTGFDVEIAQEVAKRLGVKAEFKETQWDAMFAGLDAKRFDMIANQVGIKPEREEKYDFSEPYISSAAVLVTHKENKDIQSFKDLKGKKAAQSLTSNYGEIAKENGAELVGVEGFTQAIDLINSKRADATINDKLSVLDFQNQRGNAPIQIVDESKDAAHSGLMFRKDSGKLVEEVNKALAEMKEDGTYKKISEKWFGEDVSE